MTEQEDSDALLARVHARIGGGLDITTFANGTTEITWCRNFGEGGLSDIRFVVGTTLSAALLEVLAWEDDADKTERVDE
jgi:hypothetical protein